MGDISDLADVARFTRSTEGKRVMDKFEKSVTGKKIVGVSFCELSTGVSVTLMLDGGDYLDVASIEQAFAIDSLRDRYRRVLDREYYADFPERKPGDRGRRSS
jgi:hypothetical protein